MNKLSEKQEEILGFIMEYLNEQGYPPSVREIGKAVSLSSSASVHSQLQKLIDKGYLHKDPSKSRGLSIVHDTNHFNQDLIHIPVLGKVTAGNPIEAIEHTTDYFPIPTSYVKSNEAVFLLTVSGDSMINAGIHDGDQILINKTDVARNGEIVVAMNEEGEVTVKTFYKEKDHIRLQPENDDYEPILLKHCKIIGKVVGLFRFMS
ncbi:transcriptional repressor LexA [Haloplasma contractile]|uniref:LexA repressor n=1 Tax=Haloplasma contractile SSD-17B TaxID=1033810 RepID=U2DZX9_9MOLU|nr:transcriptional repressor LexA [Haloplasma contractile]ERJ13742.1 LexA repressor protein [Haloplasma contractile SSD-17B]